MPERVRADGLGYEWHPQPHITMRFDYITAKRDEVHAELTVSLTLPGLPSHLWHERMRLESGVAKRSAVKALLSRAPVVPDWEDYLEQFCIDTLALVRRGTDVQEVGQLPPQAKRPALVWPLLEQGRPALLFGPGGNGKSYLAAAICVALEARLEHLGGLEFTRLADGERTLYLDWEDTAESLDGRVKLVAAGAGIAPPAVLHRSCAGLFRRQIHRIAQECYQRQVRLLVIDSVGLAGGSAGEGQTYEMVALEFFEALRLLPPTITVLLVDHVTGDHAQRGKAGEGRAIGSIYKTNAVRNAWETRKQQEYGASSFDMGLYHTKTNTGQLHPPFGIRLDFTPSAVTLTRCDLSSIAGLRKRQPIWRQVARLLRCGPIHQEILAEITESATTHSLNADLGRYKTLFRRDAQRNKFWALLQQDVEDMSEDEYTELA